jgi:thiamine pyrophosphokinase
MSSHHIVREKQEPALLVLGMDNFSEELLGQLLEWAPTVIVNELMAEKLTTSGIKIDWIIGDNDDDDLQSDVKFIRLQDNSVINSAFEFLVTNKYPAVNVITDELDLDDYLPFTDKINLVLFNRQRKIYAINSGFSKWKPAGEIIELCTAAHQLEVEGLEHIEDNRFKTTADGIISLQFIDNQLFISESL